MILLLELVLAVLTGGIFFGPHLMQFPTLRIAAAAIALVSALSLILSTINWVFTNANSLPTNHQPEAIITSPIQKNGAEDPANKQQSESEIRAAVEAEKMRKLQTKKAAEEARIIQIDEANRLKIIREDEERVAKELNENKNKIEREKQEEAELAEKRIKRQQREQVRIIENCNLKLTEMENQLNNIVYGARQAKIANAGTSYADQCFATDKIQLEF